MVTRTDLSFEATRTDLSFEATLVVLDFCTGAQDDLVLKWRCPDVSCGVHTVFAHSLLTAEPCSQAGVLVGTVRDCAI